MELKRHFESTTTFVPHSSNTKSEDIDHMQQSRWGIIFLGLREGEVLGDLFFCYCIHNNTRKKLNPSLSLPFSQKSKRSESEYLFVFLLNEEIPSQQQVSLSQETSRTKQERKHPSLLLLLLILRIHEIRT
jgi:hypothetical protein